MYRANRVVNFAQGDLGAVPASLAVLLIVSTGINYVLSFVAGLAAAIVLGVLVETLIIRRFFRAPRLILTVATIGLAQVLVGAGLFLPRLFGDDSLSPSIEPPFTLKFSIGGTIFNANDVITMIVIPVVFVALAIFLRRSNVGIAVRAAAERADRATTLGIPVKRLHTYVWVIATVLAYIAMFLRAGRGRPADRQRARAELPPPGARRRGHRADGALPHRSRARRSVSASSTRR